MISCEAPRGAPIGDPTAPRVPPRRWIPIVLLLIIALAIVLRAPVLFKRPRFWAEEGYYFANAFNHPWYRSILQPHFGYLSLFGNTVALLATLVPLRQAPLVTTATAFLVQLLPFTVVLWSTQPWDTLGRKVLGCLVILVTPQSTEVWLATIHSQFFLVVATFLVLLEDPDGASRLRRLACRALLVLAGLTGAVSCFLAPLFVVKAWLRRRADYTIQAALVSACAALQLTAFWATLERNPTTALRFAPPDLRTSSTVGAAALTIPPVVTLRTMVLPVAGEQLTQRLAARLADLRTERPGEFALASAGSLLVALSVLGLVGAGMSPRDRVLAIGGYLAVTVLTLVSSNGPMSTWLDVFQGERYFYAPAVMLALMVVHGTRPERGRWTRARARACTALLVALVATGTAHYRVNRIAEGGRRAYSKWPAEVARWEADPTYRLNVWPAGFQIRLVRPGTGAAR